MGKAANSKVWDQSLFTLSGGRYYSDASKVPTISEPLTLGPYTVAWYETGLTGSQTEIADYIIFYPTDAPGTRKAGVWCGGLGNVVISAPERNYTNYVETDNLGLGYLLASWGYVCMQSEATGTAGAGPAARANTIIQSIDRLVDEASRSGGPLNGMISTTSFFACGQSNGGAGAWIAQTSDSRIDAVMCWEPVAGGLGTPSSISAPILIFSAENGSPADDGSSLYSAVSGQAKVLCQLNDDGTQQYMHDAGRALAAKWWVSDQASAAITTPTGVVATLQHSWDVACISRAISFLKAYMDGNTAYKTYLVTDSSFQSFSSANL